MGSHIDRQTDGLAESYLKGGLSRRAFVTRLLALGLAPGAVASVVAACSNPSPSASSSNAAPGELAGNVRFLVGPWSNEEVAHQQHIAKGFQALHPKVTFSFRLYDWGTAAQQINTSVIEGAQDIYMTTESSYPDYEAHDTFADLTARINDSVLRGGKGEVSLHGPDRVVRSEDPRPADQLARRGRHVREHGHGRGGRLRRDFVDTWATFLDAVTKMTKPGKTYGFGIGIQIGGYGEWYQRLRAAGGSYLTPGPARPSTSTIRRWSQATQQIADLFKKGIAPPLGTYTTTTRPAAFAAGKMAIYSSDLAIDDGAARDGALQLEAAAVSAGPVTRVNFNDLSLYMINPQSRTRI